jgi:hypothetical protein
MSETSRLDISTAVRSANLGEGARTERRSRLRNLWRVVRAHLIGDVPITELDLGRRALPSGRPAQPAPQERRAVDETPAERDLTVDEASEDSFPASDPPSSTASRV